MTDFRVASTQFSLEALDGAADFFSRAENLVKKAKGETAQAILFPEYFSLGLATRFPGEMSFYERLQRLDEKYREEFLAVFSGLAKKYGLWIIAGTTPVVEAGKLVNRCYTFGSEGEVSHQDKINMTRFEKEEWHVQGGAPALQIFAINGVKCAVNICYDIEFPPLAQALQRERVEVIFVPSCTDDVHGYWRVRHCAQARCVENQAYVVMSSIVGGQKDFPEIEVHYGQAGIFSPCDTLFPERGILEEGDLNREGVVVEALDLAKLQFIRTQGTVLNLSDALSASQIKILR